MSFCFHEWRVRNSLPSLGPEAQLPVWQASLCSEDPHLTPPGLKEGEMIWKEQLGFQDDKCHFQFVTGTPAMVQASHCEPWKTSVRDGENTIGFSFSHYLSLPSSSQ